MDDVENKQSEKSRFVKLSKASIIAVSSDLFLIFFKIGLAIITGSIIFRADAYHSGGDLAVSLTVFFSILIKYKFPKKHFAREAEAIVSLLISIILIFAGIKIIIDALNTKAEALIISRGLPLIFAFIGMSFACLITLLISSFKSKVGKENNSIAFTAEGLHTYSDFISSFGVWLTLILSYFGLHIERAMTFIIGLAVFQIGLKLLFKVFKLESFNNFIKTLTGKILSIKIAGKIFEFFGSLKSRFTDNFKNNKYIKKIFIRTDFFEKNIKKFVLISIGVALILYTGLGFYKVLPYQTGVEFLFGKVIKLNKPGLHYYIPEPFGKLIKVDTGIAARLESGFRTNWSKNIEEPEAYLWEFSHTDGKFIKVSEEALAITGDENIIDANFLCYYNIIDPVKYAVDSKDSREILRAMFNREIHFILGKYEIDSLLTNFRGQIQEEVKKTLTGKVEKLNLGVRINKVFMQEVHPPIEVVPDYRAVASAREKKNEIIHKANGYANDLIPRSRGKGKKTVLESEIYKTEKLDRATGESKSFLLKEYQFTRTMNLQKMILRLNLIESIFSKKTIYIIPSQSKKRYYLALQPAKDESKIIINKENKQDQEFSDE